MPQDQTPQQQQPSGAPEWIIQAIGGLTVAGQQSIDATNKSIDATNNLSAKAFEAINANSKILKGHAEEINYLKLENEERKSENKKMKTQLDNLEQRGLTPPRANGGECNNLTAVLCSCLNATFFLRYIICISTEQRSSH